MDVEMWACAQRKGQKAKSISVNSVLSPVPRTGRDLRFAPTCDKFLNSGGRLPPPGSIKK
jgi:hypothetical protein